MLYGEVSINISCVYEVCSAWRLLVDGGENLTQLLSETLTTRDAQGWTLHYVVRYVRGSI